MLTQIRKTTINLIVELYYKVEAEFWYKRRIKHSWYNRRNEYSKIKDL